MGGFFIGGDIMETIDFKELSDEEKNYLINQSDKRSQEEILTEAEVKEKIGGAVGAAKMLLEDVFYTPKIFKLISKKYNKTLERATKNDKEILEKEEQKMLSKAAYYKMSYSVIKEAMETKEIIYLDIEKERPYRSVNQIMSKLGEHGEVSFITIHKEEDEIVFKFHVIKIKDEGFITNSDFIEEEDLKWLKYDYKDFFKNKEKEGEKNEKNSNNETNKGS